MDKDIRQVYKNNLNTFLVLLIPIAIFAKVIEEILLPANYFFDSNRINSMVVDIHVKTGWYSGTYKETTDFFRTINVFHFTERIQWSLFLGTLMMIVVILMFKRVKGLDTSQIVFAAMCVGLLNIYIFNISKDVLQFGIFCIIYIVLIIKKLPLILKALITAALMYWESSVYRSYYIIMAFFFIIIFIVFHILRKNSKKLRFMHYLFIIVGIYAMVFCFLLGARTFYKKEYNQIMETRNYSNKQNQTSAIKEPIEHNGDLGKFFIDYMINSVRMMFPIELVTIGVFYLPFFAFQIFMLFYLIRGIKRMDELDDKSFIALCVFIAYYLGSVLFEPDFGSFVRHETATFPVIMLMVFNETMYNEKAFKEIKLLEKEDKELVTDF